MWVTDLGEEMRVAVVEAQKVAALPYTCVYAVLPHAAPPCIYIGPRNKGTCA